MAEELNEELPRVNIHRNTASSSLWNDYEVLGRDNVSVIISDVRVEIEVVKAAATFDFRFPTSQRFRVVFINWSGCPFSKYRLVN